MTLNTRIKADDRSVSVNHLMEIINNIPKFVEMPCQDHGKWVNIWNGKFPRELFESLASLKRLGYQLSSLDTTSFRVYAEVEGKFYTTPMRVDWMTHNNGDVQPMRMSKEMATQLLRQVRHGGAASSALFLSYQELESVFGDMQAAAWMEWIQQTAQLRGELKNAAKVIEEVFAMAKTAGQIKRMVPDLLQYLPAHLRQAYEEQKRASSMPFEWAPYNKADVERMILTVSKGHLLANMSKPLQNTWHVGSLDSIMWGQECNVITAPA